MTAIRAIGCALPELEVTNADLERANPAWEMDRVVRRSGVVSRRVAAPDETAFDLSLRACDALAAESGVDLGAIDAILYCTQSPDYPMPGNAHLLHASLGLGDDVLAFDFNLACSGFVYGLTLAEGLLRSGAATDVLLVTAETYSKRTHAGDRSTRALFGDGAAVTRLTAEGADGDGRDGGGFGKVVATKLCTHGRGLERVYIPAGGARQPRGEETARETTDANGNVRTAEDMAMDGRAVWAFVNSALPGHLRGFLAEQSLTVEDVDLFVFHQASQMTLDSLARALGIDDEKVYVHLAHVGNLVSASIPFALRAARDEGAIGAGDRVLLSGFGAGISYGSALVEC